ncbi:MAG TPA: LamG-like jellyroll fold domain-containing protein, partial [Chthoniobacteraceae bacterium]|nr:LamG-like jellyroll fold domain-containing protein [Chthoniobacteraceae bacterium]
MAVSLLLALSAAALAQTNITVWQVDLQHSGNNANETILTPGNVGASGAFGFLFSQPMDGQTYGQPLIASGVNVSGTPHNLVYVCTEHCSIYAFDGDSNTGVNTNAIWHDSLLPAGTVPVPQSVVGSGDISIELGITTTPVIDMSTNTIYIVSKVQRTSDTTYHQYLYALDLATGATKFNSPVEINPTFPGSSSDSSGGQVPFSALHEHTRAAMTLYNGVVYISYASHSDTTPYHGEIIGFDKTTLQVVKKFNATPNGSEGGIWQGGAGPAFDSAGNIFVSIANGSWDQKNSQNGADWGESMLKIDTSGTGSLGLNLFSNTLNWFTPNNWQTLNNGDLDVGSGGLCLLPDQAGPHTHIMVGGGKGAVLYVVDRDNLSGINTPDQAIQEIPEPGGNWLFMTPAYFNGYIYYSASGGNLEQRAVGYNAANGTYISTTPITSTATYNGKGRGCFISSSGTANGVVWILTGGGINAYNAANVSGNPIFSANSTLPGNIGTQNTKFALPMVANGKLYYTAYDSTNTGHLLVYGLISSGTSAPILPTSAIATANTSSAITLTWSDNSTNETGFAVKRATTVAGPFTQIGIVAANVTTYTDSGLTPNTTYFYQVVAFNANGNSAPSNTASATTFPYYYENGLVAYWNLDETGGNTVNDLTVNGHTGTINGEAGLLAGLINNGVEFHGTGQATSNITVPNKADLQFAANQSFTLATWVNPAALRNSEETIIAKSADQGNAYGIWINASNQWVFRGPGGDIVGPVATEGTWTHVAVVQDGAAGTRKLYINGALAASGAAQAGDGAGDLWMAQQNVTGNLESFPGTLDEVRLYNRALAASEITNLMGPPVLAAVSYQTQGSAGTFGTSIWPSATTVIEGRKGATAGQYKLVLNFPTAVSGITATLGLQGGGTAVGSVNSLTYDSTKMVVTVNLTGVANDQALDLHLSGITPGGGTADIPFNILWGDVNGDGVVDSLDLAIVQNNHTSTVTSATDIYDINGDGAVDSSDDALVSAAIGTSLGSPSDVNLALYQPATASSSVGNNTPNLAFDSNTTTQWQSTAGVDPGWIYVDLGSVCTIH